MGLKVDFKLQKRDKQKLANPKNTKLSLTYVYLESKKQRTKNGAEKNIWRNNDPKSPHFCWKTSPIDLFIFLEKSVQSKWRYPIAYSTFKVQKTEHNEERGETHYTEESK